MERRAFEVAELRVVEEEGKPSKLVGYAAVFNENSVPLNDGSGPFTERIQPGAFSGAMGDDVRALLNHNPDIVLGRSRAGTLRIAEDQRGLAFELDLPETQAGRDLGVSVKRGDITGMSFAFKVPKGGDSWAKVGSEWLRTLRSVRLVDISPATFPAYTGTEIALRTADVADAVAGLEAARQAERQALAKRSARERRLRLLERDLPPGQAPQRRSEEQLQQFALARVNALEQAGVEKREQSIEDRLHAIYRALRKLLGSPYDSEATWWMIWATYPDKVIVQRFNGATQLWLYPMTFDAQGVPTFGEAVLVEIQFVPVQGAA